jgi:protein-disulfide isomerase-like protein with CxxC motif
MKLPPRLAGVYAYPTLFLETANKALTEEDGRYFQQVAQLLAA